MNSTLKELASIIGHCVKNFENPDVDEQPRDEHGQWTDGEGANSEEDTEKDKLKSNLSKEDKKFYNNFDPDDLNTWGDKSPEFQSAQKIQSDLEGTERASEIDIRDWDSVTRDNAERYGLDLDSIQSARKSALVYPEEATEWSGSEDPQIEKLGKVYDDIEDEKEAAKFAAQHAPEVKSISDSANKILDDANGKIRAKWLESHDIIHQSKMAAKEKIHKIEIALDQKEYEDLKAKRNK